MVTITNYLNKERCQKIALRYTNKENFYNEANVAFNISIENGWIDEICKHMEIDTLNKKPPRFYWTKERCITESKKYKTIQEFSEKSNWVYNKSKKNDWLKDMNLINNRKYKPIGYWKIKENCEKEALKYETFTDFQTYSKSGYLYAWKNDWLDDICSHMKKYKRIKKELINN
jgi:hypothetical protein